MPQSSSGSPELDTAVLETLQKKALLDVQQAATAADLEQKLAVLKLLSEVEKNRIETEKAKPQLRSEGVRFWTPIWGSLIGTAALVATLGVQIHNSSVNSAQQRDANEESEWREMLATVRSQSAAENRAGAGSAIPVYQLAAVQLKSFLDAPQAKHRPEARALAVYLLQGSTDQRIFDELIDSAFPTIRPDNLGEVVQIDKSVAGLYRQAQAQLQLLNDQVNASQQAPPGGDQTGAAAQTHAPPRGIPELTARRDAEQVLENSLEAEVSDISKKVVAYVRGLQPADKPKVDLSGGQFWNTDWSGVVFGDLNLNGAYLDSINLDDADLSGLKRCQGLRISQSAWWHASKISRELLTVLLADSYSVYSAKWNYPVRTSQKDYDAGVKRLQASLQSGS